MARLQHCNGPSVLLPAYGSGLRGTVDWSLPAGNAPVPVVLCLVAALALGSFSAKDVARAQSSTQPPSVQEDTIAPYGSDMTVHTEKRDEAPASFVGIVESSATAAQKVNELSKLNEVRIVHLPADKQVDAAIESHEEGIRALQTALEGNALTFAALNAQSILPSQVVGIRIEGDRHKVITIYTRR